MVAYGCWTCADTEIDWVAYMQQVQSFVKGERDYSQIKGQTGPLVYPAGFLYTFTALFYATSQGSIAMAQWLFAVAYLVNQYTVMRIYIATQAVPPWTLLLLCLSKRVHSIFLLRLFNDGITMLLANIAMLLLVQRRWRLSLLLFSAALSVKMNVLLLAPPVGIVLLQATKWKDIGIGTAAAVILQLTVGVPFLLRHPRSYLSKAFEFSREFLYEWSVNWRFVPESTFRSRYFATALVGAHLGLLLLFSHCKWCRSAGGLHRLVLTRLWNNASVPPVAAKHIVMTLFSGNLIGVVCARTLHFQFYSWYFHMLPFLLWQTKLRTPFRLLLLLCVECAWNVFPTTLIASAALFICHCVLLTGLWQTSGWMLEQPNRD
ncbi:hypothetical protein ABBQ32_010927 [Trebouxia sp. C0010 RCD-2024]